MKTISVLVISVVVGLLIFSAASAENYEGTYMGTYYPNNGGPQDMVLSLGQEGGYATFYHIGRGTRKVAPIADVKPAEEDMLIFHILVSSSGEKMDKIYNVKLANDAITGSAFGGMINLKRIGIMACPIDQEAKKIIAPC